MYRWFVARKTRGLFERLSEGDAGPFLSAVGDDIVFTYPGKHAMAGTMRGKEALGEWFERFFRAFPGLRWTIHEVVVDGWPWGTTTVSAEWSVHATLENGYVFENDGVHMIRLRGAKPREIQVYLDTQASAAALASLGTERAVTADV